MREPARGPLGRVTSMAEGFIATMRRRQQEREPRVVLYDAKGRSRVLAPDAPGHDDLLDTGERMVEAAAGE